MEWLSEPADDAGDGNDGSSTDASVTKGPSVVGLAALLAIIAAVGLAVLMSPSTDRSAAEQATAESVPPPVETSTPQAQDTDRSQSTAERSTTTQESEQKLPERGAFREAFVARLVADCDKLIDGPEPIQAGLYREHGRCLAESMERLDERCRLAAAVFYVLPGDEALDAACDIDDTRSTDFRASVRQSMVLQCDVQRDQRTEQSHEAYYEYDRCLQQIDPALDETCYLVARAQFLAEVESVLRQACDIDDEVDLSAIVG